MTNRDFDASLQRHAESLRQEKGAGTLDPKQIVLGMKANPTSQWDSHDHAFRYIDPISERQFSLRQYVQDDGSSRFFLEEYEPNGRMAECNAQGHCVRAWDDDRIPAIESTLGPNTFMRASRALGLDPAAMVFTGGGLGTDSRYFDSLDACAVAISTALSTNVRYCDRRELSEDEKARNAVLEKESSAQYWRNELASIATAEVCIDGLLKGGHTMMGDVLHKETVDAIKTYLSYPTQTAWNAIRGYCVAGPMTLWQLWCEHDPAAPRSGSVGFPRSDVLQQAIRHGITARKQRILDEVRFIDEEEAAASRKTRKPGP